MREECFNLVRGTDNPVLAGNLAREYLQARILLALQQAGTPRELSWSPLRSGALCPRVATPDSPHRSGHPASQRRWSGPVLDQVSWKPLTLERVSSIDWDAAERDVAPFLEPGPATELFGRENLLKLLEG